MRKSAYLLCAYLLVLLPACGLLLEKEREVIAEITGEQPIRLKDLHEQIRGMAFEERAMANNPDLEVAVQARRNILQKIVVDRLMVLEAQERGITISEEEMERALGSMAQPPEADEGHAEGVQEGGASGRAHKHEEDEHSQWEIEEAHNKLLIDKILIEELSDAVVDEYYLAHFKEEFAVDPPIVSYEVVGVAPENKSIVDALHKLTLEQKGTLFDAYEALGRPPQVLEAGITQPMPLDGIASQVREKIEVMEKYDISEPFHFVQNGEERYIVIRLVKNMKRKPLRWVKEEIRNKLTLQLIQDLENKFKVQYYYDKLNYRVGE
jgi:hypothetical protein